MPIKGTVFPVRDDDSIIFDAWPYREREGKHRERCQGFRGDSSGRCYFEVSISYETLDRRLERPCGRFACHLDGKDDSDTERYREKRQQSANRLCAQRAQNQPLEQNYDDASPSRSLTTVSAIEAASALWVAIRIVVFCSLAMRLRSARI